MSVNDALRDLVLSHQVGINRLTNREVRRVHSILSRIERELVRLVREDQFAIGDPTFRLERLLTEMNRVIPGAYGEMQGYLNERLVELGKAEADMSLGLIKRAMGREAVAAIPRAFVTEYGAGFFEHLARSRPFQGKLMRQWAKALESNTRKAIGGAIREGIREGLSVQKVARLIRGTRASGYTNGLLEKVTRQQAEAMVRTATQHVMQGAKQKVYQSTDLVKGYQWLSTLDMRTTLEWCVPRDGLVWTKKYEPIDHSYTWGAGPGRVHWNCRSSFTAVLKSWEEMGVNAKELSPSTRASMDGQVAATTTAEDWLKRQLGDPGRRGQLERTWGVERVRLFESGKLTVEDMVKRDGGLVSLKKLRALSAA